MKYLIGVFCLSMFVTLWVCAANILSARKNAQLRANRKDRRWLRQWNEFSGSGGTTGSPKPLEIVGTAALKGVAKAKNDSLPDSLRKEVITHTSKRAIAETKDGDGARDLDRLAEWKKLNPFPKGRFSTPNN